MRLFILIFLGVILYCLGSALYFLVREQDENEAKKVVRALTWRIALSISLFFLLLLFGWMGWITPHSVGH